MAHPRSLDSAGGRPPDRSGRLHAPRPRPTYTRETSKNKYGHLQYGSWGYEVNWKKYKASGNGCNGIEIGRGTATLPTSETGWKYRETSS